MFAHFTRFAHSQPRAIPLPTSGYCAGRWFGPLSTLLSSLSSHRTLSALFYAPKYTLVLLPTHLDYFDSLALAACDKIFDLHCLPSPQPHSLTMTATPPLQILSSPATPPSPLHGAKYDRSSLFPPRRSTRAATRTTSRSQQTTPDPPRRSSRAEQAATPRSPKSKSKTHTAAGLQSPEVTPKTRGLRRVQIMSPPSPNPPSLSSSSRHPPPTKTNTHLQPQSSATTTIVDGMLPTPVKTPKKKAVNASATTTARALFQEPQMAAQATPGQPSSRRSRKPQRFNGFSLERVSEQDDADRDQIQIFTDSRDRVPQVDHSLTNPFVERKRDRESTPPSTAVRTSKRRKVSAVTRIDPQVTDAIDKDEGMVYVL